MLPLVKLTGEEIERIIRGVPGGERNIQDIYSLAPLQEGILFHHLLGGEGDPYLQAGLWRFDSRPRLESFVKAMQAVIDRHDILRTAVMWEGLPEPVQVVWREAPLPVEEVVLDPAVGDVGMQLHARFDPRQYRLDVRQAPLLRAYIAHDSIHERWLMMLLLHHLAGDHTTLEVMQEEIQAHLLGRSEQLPEPLPFRNLVAQARLGMSREEHEVFFQRLLGDVEEPTTPFGLLDVRGDGTGIQEARVELDASLARRIRERVRKLGVSAASLCHLAWALMMARVSGREDVVFGTVLFGRMQGGAGGDRVMGPFINTLPARIRIGEEGVEASVRRTHTLLADLMRHEHASLALVQRCSGVRAPMPLFSALLNYRHSPREAQVPSTEAVGAWEGIEGLHVEERTNYPLTFSIDDLGEGFEFMAQVNGSIGSKRVCELMCRALESLVTALERTPGRAVNSLEVLPEWERQQVLYEWNAAEVEFPSEKCIHELFEEQVEKIPDAVAVVFEKQSLTYVELNARANRLGHYLRSLGVKPDERVAICVERGLEMVVALLAVLKAGGAYVPLDPAYPVERLRYMLEDSVPVALLTQGGLAKLIKDVKDDLPVIDLAAEDMDWAQQRATNLDLSSVGLTSNHLAYVIYTSGSTGRSKGVLVSHRNVARLMWATENWYQFNNRDVWTLFHSYAFDFSVWELWGSLLYGGRLVVVPYWTTRSPEVFYRLLVSEGVTVLNQTPSAFQQLMRVEERELESGQLKLRLVIFGGEALELRSLRPFIERHGDESPRLVNMYGITETTVHTTYRPLRASDIEEDRGSVDRKTTSRLTGIYPRSDHETRSDRS